MWYTINVNQDGNTRKIVSNWQGVVIFMMMNLESAEYFEISQWVTESFAAGYPVAGWTWDNGDSFEIYCPAYESLPTTVNAPVVINPLRKAVNSLVSAIL